MIKDVIVSLSAAGKRDPAADYAISVAATFGAHIAGVAFAYEPVLPVAVVGQVPGDLIDNLRREADRSARAAADRFDKAAVKAGLSVETHVVGESSAHAADLFGQITRRFDLSVVGQPERDRDGVEELIAEGALFESGRPTIVVPYIQKGGLTLDRVLVCWDGSRAAARAIGDAVPFLTRAKNVHVVIVAGDRGKSDELPGVDVGQHLARHGIKVEINRVAAADIDVASAILSYAADQSADFLVMGGYGHSRLREFVLGGVTSTILQSMTLPALMSH
jgi:nucleotide-binding universal stress UspA family protein